MKQRAIKRCIKRTQNQLRRGTFRGRHILLDKTGTSALFISSSGSLLTPCDYGDCYYQWVCGKYRNKGHGHWLSSGHRPPMAVSHV